MKNNFLLSSLVPTLAVLCSCSASLAQEPVEPLVTDRPDFTESPLTVPAGRVQVEGGVTSTRSGASRDVSVGELLVRVATGSRSELRLGVPSYLQVRGGGSGWDDSYLGAKFVLASARGGAPDAALLVGTTLPTGGRNAAERTYQPDARLALGWGLTESLSLGVNLGYARPTDGGARFDQLLGSVSLAQSLSDKWGAYAEVFGYSKVDSTGKSGRYINTGVTHLLNPDFQLDARVGVGLANRVGGPDYFFGVGAARRF